MSVSVSVCVCVCACVCVWWGEYLIALVTSATEVMFLPLLVCLSAGYLKKVVNEF